MEKNEIITNNLEETQQLARDFAKNLKGGEVICLAGDLGAGKTSFAQGLLQGLGADGPYTSPTFLIMKEYESYIPQPTSRNLQPKNMHGEDSGVQDTGYGLKAAGFRIYHIDAYRISEDDLMNLGWEEIVVNKNNIIILEWPEKVEKILPEKMIYISFEWIDENKRKIIINKNKL